jgi:hypothetical protein
MGQQYKVISTGPDVDKNGKPLRKVDRKLGFDLDNVYTSPSQGRENFSDTNFPTRMEAPRSMQPMTGGPPRFMTVEPKLNHYAPVDLKKYAVDTDHPITNYGCDDIYSASGQAIKLEAPNVKEDFGNSLPSDMMSLAGEPAQPVIADRKMYANIKSKYRRNPSDPFRGDIKVIPTGYMSDGDGKLSYKEKELGKWFQVTPTPSVDLTSGYIDQHTERGAEFIANAEATGLDPNIFETRSDNRDIAKALVRHRNRDENNRPSVVEFGSSNFESSSRPVSVKYGTDIEVGSYGV